MISGKGRRLIDFIRTIKIMFKLRKYSQSRKSHHNWINKFINQYIIIILRGFASCLFKLRTLCIYYFFRRRFDYPLEMIVVNFPPNYFFSREFSSVIIPVVTHHRLKMASIWNTILPSPLSINCTFHNILLFTC